MRRGVLRGTTARRKGSDTIESFGIVNHSILELARGTIDVFLIRYRSDAGGISVEGFTLC